MGVSNQIYRSRIGSFLPKSCKFSTISNIENKKKEPTNLVKLRILLPIILFVLTPILSTLVAGTCAPISTAQSYTHPLYPELPTTFLQPGNFCKYSNLRSCNITTDIVGTFILQCGVNTVAASIFSMISNFQSRYTNGNRKANGIKISHWNKGPGHLHSKMPEIKNIIKGLHPHILGLSEANLKQSHDQKLVQIEDYVLHT